MNLQTGPTTCSQTCKNNFQVGICSHRINTDKLTTVSAVCTKKLTHCPARSSNNCPKLISANANSPHEACQSRSLEYTTGPTLYSSNGHTGSRNGSHSRATPIRQQPHPTAIKQTRADHSHSSDQIQPERRIAQSPEIPPSTRPARSARRRRAVAPRRQSQARAPSRHREIRIGALGT